MPKSSGKPFYDLCATVVFGPRGAHRGGGVLRTIARDREEPAEPAPGLVEALGVLCRGEPDLLEELRGVAATPREPEEERSGPLVVESTTAGAERLDEHFCPRLGPVVVVRVVPGKHAAREDDPRAAAP
jgi:hypothetical protein